MVSGHSCFKLGQFKRRGQPWEWENTTGAVDLDDDDGGDGDDDDGDDDDDSDDDGDDDDGDDDVGDDDADDDDDDDQAELLLGRVLATNDRAKPAGGTPCFQ